MTSQDLDAIDALLVIEGLSPQPQNPPPWFTSVFEHPELVTQELKALHVRGFAAFPPLRKHSKYQRSRWVCVQEGETLRVVPELHLRASHAFGPLSLLDVPVWATGVEGGEVRIEHKHIPHTQQRLNKYGHAPGTKEYQEEWLRKNQERRRKYAREYQAKIRIAMRALKAHRGEEDTRPSTTLNPLEEMAKKLGIDPQTLAAHTTTPLESLEETPCPRCGTELTQGRCDWCGWPEAASRIVD